MVSEPNGSPNSNQKILASLAAAMAIATKKVTHTSGTIEATEHPQSASIGQPVEQSSDSAAGDSEPTNENNGELEPLMQKLGPVIYVSPADCYPYPGTPRAGLVIDALDVPELRDSIESHGVLEPIVLMRLEGRYLILGGNRRHAIVSAMHDQGHLVQLPARVADFTELEAVAFAHAQNAGRIDPTAMEQAHSVLWAIETLAANQSQVAAAMGISPNKVSRLLVLANLPPWVLAIVTNPATLSENFAAVLQGPLSDPAEARVLEKRANAAQRRNLTFPGPAAARYLLTGTIESVAQDILEDGQRLGTLKANTKGGITLRIAPSYIGKTADVRAIHAKLSENLLEAMLRCMGNASKL